MERRHPTAPALVASLTGPTDRVEAVAFSPDRRVLATGNRDSLIRLWDVTDRTRPGSARTSLPTGRAGAVRSLAYSPDGRVLASGGEDGAARLWDPATGARSAGP